MRATLHHCNEHRGFRVALTGLLVCLLFAGSLLSRAAAAEDDDWPVAEDFTGVYRDPTGEQAEKIMQQMARQKAEHPPGKVKRLWYRLMGIRELPGDGNTDHITQVGPQAHPASSAPILALTAPLRWNGVLIPIGFYRVDQNSLSETERLITLSREGHLMARMQLHLAGSSQEPVEALNAGKQKTPVTTQLQAVLSPDHRQMVVVMKSGDQLFQSDRLPTAVEKPEAGPDAE
ncbi:MAG: hypothetical protein AB7P76_10950 [Candidatus Melainabacteria bacterium]